MKRACRVCNRQTAPELLRDGCCPRCLAQLPFPPAYHPRVTAWALQRLDAELLALGRARISRARRERQIFAFYFGRGFRQQDIADAVGVSQQTVAATVRRIRRKFLTECGVRLVRPARGKSAL